MNNSLEDTFFCSFKCITGEEVLAEICGTEDSVFLVSNPIVIREVSSINPREGTISMGISPRKWMAYGSEDLTIVNKTHIVSMSQLDKFGVDFYQKALLAAKVANPIRKKIDTKDNTGYMGNIEKARTKLERLFDKN